MTKGIVYYTHRGAEPLYAMCRKQLDRANPGLPVVSVSLTPLPWHRNLVVDGEPSVLTMFRQQLAGLQALDTDVVYFCEHDVLYHHSHFEFTPPREDVYYFNTHVWVLNALDGTALYYDTNKMTSGTVAHRDILVEHYTKKVELVEQQGFSHRDIGYEPGKDRSRHLLGDYDVETFRSAFPNVDIKHGGNITKGRFRLEEYRNRNRMRASWTVTDRIPGWGVTRGRVADFFESLS